MIQAPGDGWNVTFVTGVSGGVSREVHDVAAQRMIMAGGNPMTRMVVIAEWQRDWARVATAGTLARTLVARPCRLPHLHYLGRWPEP